MAYRLGAEYRPGKLTELRQSLNSAALLPFQPSMLLSIHSAASHGFLAGIGTDINDILEREPINALEIAVAAAAGI
ncbi:hypothetical protein NicSoilB11_17990 [Arthrobacter sp. NicSoilB11]|nr:hypothetical protein NicSoilB11_17990 [Arthrobacter sp. NicSoilB11]